MSAVSAFSTAAAGVSLSAVWPVPRPLRRAALLPACQVMGEEVSL